MAKEIKRIAKLQFIAGKAKPGPELAGLGIVMPEFTRQFNDATKDRGQEPVPVAITVFSDRSFSFKLFTAPASYKLLQAANLKKGAQNAKSEKVATISKAQLQEIAEYKIKDLNTNNIEAAMRTIAGTAKNMGILIEDIDDVVAEKKAAAEAAKNIVAAEAKEVELNLAAAEAVENKNTSVEVETSVQSGTDQEGDA